MKKLTENWPWKLASVLLACVIWVVVTNTADPVETYSFNNIPITVINEDVIAKAGKSYTVEGKLYASVRVKASHSVINSLKASDFTATADASKMFEITGQIPVEVSCANRNISSSQITLQTNSIRMVLEDIQTKRFIIQVETSGEPAEDRLLGGITAEPASVTVTAPVSVIEKIAVVSVKVPVDGVAESVSQKAQIQFFREDGSLLNTAIKEAKDTKVSAVDTEVSVEVLSVKSLPIVIEGVSDKDKVEEGFRYTGHVQSAKSVQVSGFTSLLADVNAITIPGEVLSVAEAAADREIEVDLTGYLPEGVSIVKGQPESVVVTLQVEELSTKVVDVRELIEYTGMNSRYEYTFGTDPVNVTLRALKDELEGFSTELLSVSVDLSGLQVGEHDIPVEVVCSESVFGVLYTDTVRVKIENPHTEPGTETSEDY